MAEEWSYHRLCDVYREEKSTNSLVPLASDFHRSLQEMLSHLQLKVSESHDNVKELDNARRQIRLLMRLRRQKLMMRASMEQAGTEPEGMTASEKSLYDRIRGMYSEEDEQLEGLLHPLPAGGPIGAKSPGGNGGAFNPNSPGASAPIPSKRKVKFIADVPAYRGADDVVYGPFGLGQTLELPSAEAESLLRGKMAEEASSEEATIISSSPKSKVRTRRIKVTFEVPKYRSTDGDYYGPFKDGDEVEVPEKEAEWLIGGKMAYGVGEWLPPKD